MCFNTCLITFFVTVLLATPAKAQYHAYINMTSSHNTDILLTFPDGSKLGVDHRDGIPIWHLEKHNGFYSREDIAALEEDGTFASDSEEDSISPQLEYGTQQLESGVYTIEVFGIEPGVEFLDVSIGLSLNNRNGEMLDPPDFDFYGPGITTEGRITTYNLTVDINKLFDASKRSNWIQISKMFTHQDMLSDLSLMLGQAWITRSQFDNLTGYLEGFIQSKHSGNQRSEQEAIDQLTQYLNGIRTSLDEIKESIYGAEPFEILQRNLQLLTVKN